jgi:hypothetical protein
MYADMHFLLFEGGVPKHIPNARQRTLIRLRPEDFYMTVQKRTQKPINVQKRAQKPINVQKRAQKPINVQKRAQKPINVQKRAQKPINVQKKCFNL